MKNQFGRLQTTRNAPYAWLAIALIFLGFLSWFLLLPVQTSLVSNPYKGLPYWYKGQVHAHTNLTDADDNPVDVRLFYKSLGYQFLSLTDHYLGSEDWREVYCPYPDRPEVCSYPDCALLGGDIQYDCLDTCAPIFAIRLSRLIYLPGLESCDRDDHHLLAIGLPQSDSKCGPPCKDTGWPDTDRWSHTDRISHITKQGAIAVIAHPHGDWGWSEEEILLSSGYHGIEINEPADQDTWDYLLSRGRKVWGFTTDDLHAISGGSGGWIVVNSEEGPFQDFIGSGGVIDKEKAAQCQDDFEICTGQCNPGEEGKNCRKACVRQKSACLEEAHSEQPPAKDPAVLRSSIIENIKAGNFYAVRRGTPDHGQDKGGEPRFSIQILNEVISVATDHSSTIEFRGQPSLGLLKTVEGKTGEYVLTGHESYVRVVVRQQRSGVTFTVFSQPLFIREGSAIGTVYGQNYRGEPVVPIRAKIDFLDIKGRVFRTAVTDDIGQYQQSLPNDSYRVHITPLGEAGTEFTDAHGLIRISNSSIMNVNLSVPRKEDPY